MPQTKPVWTVIVQCPRCGGDMQVSDYIYEMPIVGKVLISSGKCVKCGYRHSDARAMESHGPQRLVLRVEGPEDLNALVIRSSSASIRMPELGVEINPGPAAQGFITTVEGVLDRVLQVLDALRDDPDVNKEEWARRRREVVEAKEGKRKFTFIIEDPEGVSRIVSDKAERERLYSGYIA